MVSLITFLLLSILFYKILFLSTTKKKEKKGKISFWAWLYFVVLKTNYICPSIQCETYEKKLSQCFHFLSSSVLLTWVSSGFNNHQNTTITFSKITWNLLKIAFILKLCSFACYCSSFLPEPAFSYLVLSAFVTVLLFRAVIICLPKTLQRWYYLNLYP